MAHGYTQLANADAKTIANDLTHALSLQLRPRIDAELTGKALVRQHDDPADLFSQIESQYHRPSTILHRRAGTAQEALKKSQREYDSAKEVLSKLQQITPILKQQADAYADMGKDGYAPQLTVHDKQREYLEKSQDLRAQQSTVESLDAAVNQAKKQIDQTTSKYRQRLAERTGRGGGTAQANCNRIGSSKEHPKTGFAGAESAAGRYRERPCHAYNRYSGLARYGALVNRAGT